MIIDPEAGPLLFTVDHEVPGGGGASCSSGHASVQTTECYLGTCQNLLEDDRIRLRVAV